MQLMKRIYSMGKGKYVHMDSYPENHETHPVTNFLMSLFVIATAAMTAGAMVGIDITTLYAPTNANPNRISR